MTGDARPGDAPPGEHGGDAPITPHATPRLDDEGRLTYVGEDGRRYVVAVPPPGEAPPAAP
jgi:hypothetical protein